MSDWDGICLVESTVGVCQFVILSVDDELDVLAQSHFCLLLFFHAGLESLCQVVCFCGRLCPRASPGVLTFFGWLSGALSSGVYECWSHWFLETDVFSSMLSRSFGFIA